ncbi:MAG: response regulator [Candidatus Omnitrophota bacterium]|nr:response regulator [Candidatus Omnitrophota bacterium]
MSKTILVVDDEPVIVEIARRKLEEVGFEVMTARDGQEAMACLQKKTPHLIILDVQMPKMDGYAFMIEKSKVPEYESIPVIVATAHQETAPLFERHGIRTYLLKPLKLQELLDKVAEVLGPA